MKLRGHALKDIVPAAELRLPEQAHAWVPGTILTLQQPAPVGTGRQRYPDRRAQGTREMRDGRIRGNDKVQILDDGRRIGKRPQIKALAQVDGGKIAAGARQLLAAFTDLETEQVNARNFPQ